MMEIKKYYPNAEIEYVSYIDGESSEGIILEQYVTKKVFSKYVQKDKVMYKNNF